MLKRLALVALFGISNLHATDASSKTGFIQRIKTSSVTVKVVAIVAGIVTFISMDSLLKAYKDNPEKLTISNIAYNIKWISCAIACMFGRWLLEFDIIKREQLSIQQCGSKIDNLPQQF